MITLTSRPAHRAVAVRPVDAAVVMSGLRRTTVADSTRGLTSAHRLDREDVGADSADLATNLVLAFIPAAKPAGFAAAWSSP